MTDMQRAHERLEAANPAPVDEVADRPDAHTFLASLQAESQPSRVPQPQWRPAFLAATAAFLLTVMLGGSLWLASLLRSEPDVIGMSPSTVTTTMVSTTSTTIPVDADEALNAFARTYSSGDPEAFLALLAPGVRRETSRENDPAFIWDDELLRLELEMVSVLDTDLELRSCRQLTGGTITCVASRSDNLTRIAGVGPQEDRWSFRLENGAVTRWVVNELIDPTSYQSLAIAPFTAWLAEAHPEITDPYPLSGGVRHWRRDIDVAQIRELVAEYAATLGVTLP